MPNIDDPRNDNEVDDTPKVEPVKARGIDCGLKKDKGKEKVDDTIVKKIP